MLSKFCVVFFCFDWTHTLSHTHNYHTHARTHFVEPHNINTTFKHIHTKRQIEWFFFSQEKLFGNIWVNHFLCIFLRRFLSNHCFCFFQFFRSWQIFVFQNYYIFCHCSTKMQVMPRTEIIYFIANLLLIKLKNKDNTKTKETETQRYGVRQ